MGTDKRTIDMNNDIFAAAKVSLKKGIRRFTEMTNKWKGQEKELRSLVSSLPSVDFSEVRKMAKNQTTISLRRIQTANEYRRRDSSVSGLIG